MNIFTQLAQSSYSYTTSSQVDPEAAAAAVAIMGVAIFVSFIVGIVAYVISALLVGKIFKKAGVPAWIAWVPIYNNWKLFEIGGQKGFWAILTIVPIVQFVSIVFMYIAMYHIGLKLGKSGSFVLLAIFLPIVWLIWLAVDKSVWNESLSNAPSLAKEMLNRPAQAAAPVTPMPATAPSDTTYTPPTPPTPPTTPLV